MDAGILRRLDHIGKGYGFIKQRNIFPHGSRDLEYILIHHGNRIDNHGTGDLPALYPVKQHFAGPLFIQPRHNFSHGTFTAARGAHNGNPATRLKVQVKMFQQRRIQRAVTKAYIFHGDLA